MDAILCDIIERMRAGSTPDDVELNRIMRSHARASSGAGPVGKSALMARYRELKAKGSLALTPEEDLALLALLQVKPRRTASGVATITVLTKPWPCSGNCIFCPDDERMPKSYLSSEPACQRAEQNGFDPYAQVRSRLEQLELTGHPTDKIELIVLGGTWDDYPDDYRISFVHGLFCALNGAEAPAENCSLDELLSAHAANEHAAHRCVGLSVETRPDRVSAESARFSRMLGCTKVQMGVQSLNQQVLDANSRGTSVEGIARAFSVLRAAGFKIQVHYMLNLLGSTPALDVEGYRMLTSDPRFLPDEVKLYPCALIAGTRLVEAYERREWQPYSDDVLIDTLAACIEATPAYVRISRVIRDISAGDILAGTTTANLRQLVDARLAETGAQVREIRSREIAVADIDLARLSLACVDYHAAGARERFLQWVTPDGMIAGFLRLSLPEAGDTAMIRELHVYGRTARLHSQLPGAAQHTGLGKQLVERAEHLARSAGYRTLDVISAVGTRGYYRNLGFIDEGLYQKITL